MLLLCTALCIKVVGALGKLEPPKAADPDLEQQRLVKGHGHRPANGWRLRCGDGASDRQELRAENRGVSGGFEMFRCVFRGRMRFHETFKHFSDISEDQFDFHNYCLRKTTLKARCIA